MSKFFTFKDRLIIEKGLRKNQSFGAIAKRYIKFGENKMKFDSKPVLFEGISPFKL